jgi:phage terminase large subunit-like protein
MAREASRRGRQENLDFVRLTRPQFAVVSDPRRLTLWRDGNRLGKSFAAAWEIVHRCRGTHPYLRTHRAPIKVLCVSYSLEQMEPLMGALWSLLPKREIDPRNGYDPGRGITGKPPRIQFTSGPGKGSVITFATYKAGSQKVAGGAYHFIVCDEPPTEAMYGELKPRVLTTRGTFRLFFTPTPDSPNLKWLRELVDNETVAEHNFGLNEANTWQRGAPQPLLRQAEIDSEVATWLAVEREMRLNGAWEPVVTGRWLTQFGDDNVQPFGVGDDALRNAFLIVGVDHGSQAGKQAAMLLAIQDRDTPNARVWWIDEVVSDGFTNPEQDAGAVLSMLRRRGLQYDDVDEWVGDRPTGDSRYLSSKTNKDLRIQLALQLGRRFEQLETIHHPQKWAGSVTHGLRVLNGLFGSYVSDGVPRGIVHPRCVQFKAFCERFQGDSRDPLKDVGDAGRYPVERAVKLKTWASGSSVVFA